MNAKVPATVCSVCVSMTDWTYCPDEDDIFLPSVKLQAALEVMHINMNLCAVCDYYFDEIAVGTGDILVFTSARYTDTYFIADLYREMTDQLDTVMFYVSCPHLEIFDQAKHYLRSFFEQAAYQFSYEESNLSIATTGIIESQTGDTHCVVEESGYRQKIIFQPERFYD